MGHKEIEFNPNQETYSFSGGLKTLSIVLMVLGLLGAAITFYFDAPENHHNRFWSNLLLNTYYFNGIAIVAVFFISASTIGYGGWQTLMKRIFESFGVFVYISAIFFILILLGLIFDWHGLYHHWTHPAENDTIVGDKKAFLNKTTFTVLSLIFIGGWIALVSLIRSHSKKEDDAQDAVAHLQKGKYISAAYIVLFGVSSSIFSWMAIMSLDPHWYSTLFGWYNFASYMCGFLALMILVVLYLKSKGLLMNVNENHIQDLGKFLFGFSVFYTYLWFSQFMLIWYGNIPEDTMYFYKRFNIPLFKFLFIFVFIINFVFPFLFILKREAKRNYWVIGFASIVLFFGHYLDFYLMVMPEPNMIQHEVAHEASKPISAHTAPQSTLDSTHSAIVNTPSDSTKANQTANAMISDNHAHANKVLDSAAFVVDNAIDTLAQVNHGNESHIASNNHDTEESHSEHPATYAQLGLGELFFFLGFLGIFLFTVMSTLAKERLVPKNHPFLDESLRHSI
jgi:hypothetical protein